MAWLKIKELKINNMQLSAQMSTGLLNQFSIVEHLFLFFLTCGCNTCIHFHIYDLL